MRILLIAFISTCFLFMCSVDKLTYKYEVDGSFKTARVMYYDDKGSLIKDGTIEPGWYYKWKQSEPRLNSIKVQTNDDTIGYIEVRLYRDGNLIKKASTNNFDPASIEGNF